MKKRRVIEKSVAHSVLDYDAETGSFVWKERPRSMFSGDRRFESWNRKYANKPAGNIFSPKRARTSYLVIPVLGITYRAHVIAWVLHYGVMPKGVIDHINGDGLDNRISNLRDCDLSTNASNARMYRNNKSGVCGVHWRDYRNKWVSIIQKDGARQCLGSFDTLLDAACARKSAENALGFSSRHGK